MSRVRTFFLREAGECLSELEKGVDSESTDVSAAYAAVRRLRGSAQMARFHGLARTAGALERRLRSHVGGGNRGNAGSDSGRLRREVQETLNSLRADIEAVREGRLKEDPRMEAGMEEQERGDGRDGRGVVPVETLEYRGEAALARALELRAAIEEAVGSEASVAPLLDELFDLIRLGAK